MSRHPIAIDIGNDAIHIAQLGESKKGFFVHCFASMRLDNSGQWNDETELLVTEFFKKIIKELKFSGKRSVIHLPSHCISSFPLNIQVKEDESIDQIIAGESKSYISSPLEDTIIDYPSLLDLPSGKKKRYRALIVATRKSFVESYAQVLKKSGFIIQAIDYDVNSLIRLHSYTISKPNNPVILCNIDNTQTIICAVSDKGILAERHIPWGMKYIIDRLRIDLDISKDDFKTGHLLKEYGLSYEKIPDESNGDYNNERDINRSMRKTIYQIIMPYLEEFLDEIHKVTAYLRSDIINEVIKNVYLYGMSGAIRDMDFFTERHLNIPVQIVDPMQGFQASDHKNISSLPYKNSCALALGLALRSEK